MKTIRVLNIFAFVCLCVSVQGQRTYRQQRYRRHEGASCMTPLNVVGTCVSLKFCPEVLTLYQKLGNNDATRYSKRLHQLCGLMNSDNYPVVCCTRVVTDVMEPTATTTIATNIIIETTSATTTTTTTPTPAIAPTPIIATSKTEAHSSQCQGVCKPLEECNSLYTALLNDRTNTTVHTILRESNTFCSNFGRTAVCCPDANINSNNNNGGGGNDRASVNVRLPNEEDGCGFVRLSSEKVVGGEDSQEGAWPWMALIGYNRYSAQPFKCGGTLITAWHVLTAAHCIRGDLSFVRLGEHDLSDLSDTRHVDVDVRRMVQHPNYASRSNTGRRFDLAILYLIRSVDFTDFIKPICLPLSKEIRERNYVGSLPYVAGWGRTEENGPTSNVLQELQIPIIANEECERRYKVAGAARSPDQFDESVLCAGQVVNIDSCKGDSGGPLMLPQYYKQIIRYYQLGIVSYGIGCGRGIPGVYTSIQFYIDWIQQMIADT